jgi:hypothetical protein
MLSAEAILQPEGIDMTKDKYLSFCWKVGFVMGEVALG